MAQNVLLDALNAAVAEVERAIQGVDRLREGVAELNDCVNACAFARAEAGPEPARR